MTVELNPVEQRILGSLLEKQRTVPATYPMTLNALRTACNQVNSRDPVTDYDDATLESTLKQLRHRDLVRVVWADRGPRTLKYHQLLDERLSLQPDERAVLTVLLLRGPQAPGELKTRTDRLHHFADRSEVETVLQRLAGLETPLVQQLERRPGQQDHRWQHLLGPQSPEPVPADAEVDRDQVLRAGAADRDARVIAAYDRVAASYAAALSDELDGKPFDAWLLRRIGELAGYDPIVEVGCGPGHLSEYLARSGAEVTGVDLSPGMIEQARAQFPDVRFEVGDLTKLLRPAGASGWGAVVAWYSLVHLAGSELPGAIAALTRPLRPGGWLGIAVHAGAAVHHVEEWYDEPVDLDFVLHDPGQVRAAVAEAGLVEVEWYLRGPYGTGEVETERLYVLGRTPN